jgi:TRAP-type uncharacterized transport system substrate-binding protein
MIKKSVAWVLLAGLLSSVTPGIAVDVQAKEIRWGTSRVGSTGNRAVTNLVQVLNKAVPDYNFTVQPTPGAIVTVKGYAIGDFEGYYGSDVAFYELANNIKRFEGFREKMEREPVQSLWTFTIEMGVGIHARDLGTITSWGDLDGMRVFTGPRPWDTRAQLERAFSVLGINHDYIEVGTKEAGSLLEQGRYAALGVYTNAEASTAGWLQEVSLQTDWASLSPDAGELEKLTGAGFNVVEVDTSAFGKKKTHVDKAAMLPFYYGLHLGMDVPEDDMYRILLAVEANVDELAQVDKAFKQIQKDMPHMQRRGVEAAVNLVKVHPGLAKYMRERGVWDAKWDSRIAN